MPLVVGDFVLCVLPDYSVVARKVTDVSETTYTLDYPVNGATSVLIEAVVQTNYALFENPEL